jgi:hypothetical protein
MIKKWTYCLLLCVCSSTLAAQSTTFYNHFKLQSFDTLHVYPSKYIESLKNKTIEYKGTIICNDAIIPHGIDTLFPSKGYTAILKFYADSTTKFVGYIFGTSQIDPYDSKLVLVVIDTKLNKRIAYFDLASYKYLDGTMEETMNSWILDENKDGNIEIAQLRELTDYELPNEYSDNISGVTSSMYRYENNEFVSYYMTKEMYQALRIIK